MTSSFKWNIKFLSIISDKLQNQRQEFGLKMECKECLRIPPKRSEL